MSVKTDIPDNPIAQPSPLTDDFDRQTFDPHADLYEKMFSAPYRQRLEIPTLNALLGDLTGLSVLDFGCGPGFISRWLHDKNAARVVGYDVSDGMLSYAREMEQQQPRGIQYVADLDVNLAESFDYVLAVYVMPYAPSQDKLTEMAHVLAGLLKPGGQLITLPIHPEFHPDAEYYRPYGFRLTEKQPRADGSLVNLHICQSPYDVNIDAYFWSAPTLTSTLRHAGFHSIAWHPLREPDVSQAERALLENYLHVPHAAIITAVKGKDADSASPISGGYHHVTD
ncbi:class I SAM-dependent methyltransferase [Pantoea coffeiphila]|uniref:SAM-dependent methyltransferase n=1 Tax=Pantoea coffeiphila TaxID=1465635 RepID=A0A2S9I9H5_9GAMM|nr:class I SAM-dependent methyltransferase [Pantoea coffeiphila]PRD14453.1 SAM-dependent methyltransferase [Pantoea coffeiphila]